MDENAMIEDLIKQLDKGMAGNVGHINVEVDEKAQSSKNVETMGCSVF